MSASMNSVSSRSWAGGRELIAATWSTPGSRISLLASSEPQWPETPVDHDPAPRGHYLILSFRVSFRRRSRRVLGVHPGIVGLTTKALLDVGKPLLKCLQAAGQLRAGVLPRLASSAPATCPRRVSSSRASLPRRPSCSLASRPRRVISSTSSPARSRVLDAEVAVAASVRSTASRRASPTPRSPVSSLPEVKGWKA